MVWDLTPDQLPPEKWDPMVLEASCRASQFDSMS
jgi:hypothetical protein